MKSEQVWKWDLGHNQFTELDMPKGAQVLAVQMQFSTPKLWAVVDPDAAMEKRVFMTVGTGVPIPEAKKPVRFIGTYQENGGFLVFHVFEVVSGGEQP